jgi:rhodanese-related sulfurtransferase
MTGCGYNAATGGRPMTRRLAVLTFAVVTLALVAVATPLLAQTPDSARRVDPANIDALIADGKTVVLDVREPNELEETGTVKGAIHIPLGQLEARLGELPKDKVILTACRGGGRASRAMALLEAKGFKTAGFCGLADYKGARAFPAKKS